MHRFVPGLVAVSSLATLIFTPAEAPAQTEKAAGNGMAAVVARHEAAVVSVKSVASMKMSFGGREATEEQQENECSGIVVSPAGLVLVSLSGVDPSDMFGEMMKEMGAESDQMTFSAEIKSLTIRLPDGSEVPAEVAIRDRDVDIAVLKPRVQLPAPLKHVDLSDSADVSLLDEVILISRLGKSGSWTTVADVDRVKGVLTKPRKMYFLPFSVSGEDSDVGALVLTADGKVVGIQTYHRVASSGTSKSGYYLVVMPAKELLPVVRQVQ
jgi:S1-C subfamily serine protease